VRHAGITASVSGASFMTRVEKRLRLKQSRPTPLSDNINIQEVRIMRQVLITISRGIIEQAVFFDDPKMAIQALSRYVKVMNVEHNDAAVYDYSGLIANAKHFLDDHDEHIENKLFIEEVSGENNESIYIIGNPKHALGFTVASPDDPLGYGDPVEALSDLGQMRQDFGNHLKLYRIVPVDCPVADRTDLENFIDDLEVEDFDYSFVKEYIA
jgi:hypothetical protein